MTTRICWLATGGTIASRPSEHGLVPGFTAAEMLAKVPQLRQYGEIYTEDLLSLDSTNLQPADWIQLAKAIEQRYAQYDGFVITHGTDTLAWTSCALTEMLENLAKPVVVIGSQLTLEEAGTDAYENLNAAMATATQGRAGVYAVCGGEVMVGQWAKKLYSEDMRSIQSVNHPPVATFHGDNIKWQLPEPQVSQGKFTVNCQLVTQILQAKTMPGLNAVTWYELAKNYQGVVLEAYGAGGIPANSEVRYDLVEAVERLVQEGIPVICTTQCAFNGVHMHRYEVGQRALAAGVISGGYLSTEAATVKLMVGLGKGLSIQELAQEFAKYTKISCEG